MANGLIAQLRHAAEDFDPGKAGQRSKAYRQVMRTLDLFQRTNHLQRDGFRRLALFTILLYSDAGNVRIPPLSAAEAADLKAKFVKDAELELEEIEERKPPEDKPGEE